MNCSIYSKVMQGIAVLGFILAILLCKATSIDEISAYVSGMAEFKCDFQQNISSSRLIYTWEKQPSTTTSGISTVAELNKGERKYDYVTENYKKRFMVFMPNGDLNMYNITLEDKGYYDCPVREIKDDNTKEIRHHKKYLLKVFANYSVPEISNGSFQESEDETIVNFRCTSGDGFPQPRGILWMFSDYNGTKYYPIICKTESSPPCAIKETFQTFNISSYLTMTVKSTTNVSCTVLAHHNFSSEILQIELKNETTIPSEENNPHLKYIVPCIILISFFILAAVAYYCHRRTKKTCRSIPLQNGQIPTTTVPNNDVTQQDETTLFIKNREDAA
ncbi:T-lymphocyte activation antigen CD86 [Phyllobates terribilis]|uniref:T-lymphocyte activation antigen CD86 n=1 Tax=Phyllobates terribilis TaxID=111132 RepID=UPI003CCB4619